MTTPSTPKQRLSVGRPGDLERVGDVAITGREPAKIPSPNGGGPVAIKTVDYVLLADGSEMYQCVYPDAQCFLAFTSVRSATSHQRSHSPKREASRLRSEVETLRAKKAASTERRSAGVAAGQRAAREKRADVEKVGLPEALRREAGILEERASWLRAMAATADLWGKTVSVSPEELERLREDAQQWRQLRGMLNR